MRVSYDTVRNFPGWLMARDLFQSLISEHKCTSILEVGAGANPTLSPEFVQAKGLSYVISDLSPEELKKSNLPYQQLVLDLSAANVDPSLNEKFDCVFSRMVAEHVRDGDLYHRNIYRILKPGGISAHCLSTLWNLPLAGNRLLPNSVGNILQKILAPRDERFHGKFKAYYSWSRGPSKSTLRRFEKIGFEIIEYTGYFGHNYYLRLPWLHQFETFKSNLLLQYPVPQLCTYATFVLRKPKN